MLFVRDFQPSSLYGDGGGGTLDFPGGAKIVSTDKLVGSINCTHLAHELGHALGLAHPLSPQFGLADSTTGTLMCPSGDDDNPLKNSSFNIRQIMDIGAFEAVESGSVPGLGTTLDTIINSNNVCGNMTVMFCSSNNDCGACSD